MTESEVKYLMTVEWARTAEDVVWRRSKLGLRLSSDEIAAIDDWMAARRPALETPLDNPLDNPLGNPLAEAGGRT